MAAGRITKRSVDAARPADRDMFLWDDEAPGFGLKVTPAGRKVYLVQYRLGGRQGRTRRVTIGSHGVLTPDQARTEAKRLLGEVAAGRDPADEKRRADAPALGTLLERFLVEHADAKRKATTAREYRRIAKLHVPQTLRTRLITDVSHADVARLHHALAEAPYQANRLVALLSKFFAWCERHGYRAAGSNPCKHVDKYAESRRERFLSGEELSRLGQALKAAEEGASASPYAIAAIRLLTFTGARLSEILSLRWNDVDFERGCLFLDDSKTGRKTVFLNPPALGVLAALAGAARPARNPYVICGERAGAHLINLQKPWRRIRKAAGLDDVRIHDLRHSFASVAAAGGASLPIIGALLGHSQPQTTHRYAHLAADPLRAANEAAGRRIAEAMGLATSPLATWCRSAVPSSGPKPDGSSDRRPSK